MVIKSMSTVKFPFSSDVYEITDKKAREEKIDKDQGSSNAGKLIVVGTDGQCTLTDAPIELSNIEIEEIINSIGGL